MLLAKPATGTSKGEGGKNYSRAAKLNNVHFRGMKGLLFTLGCLKIPAAYTIFTPVRMGHKAEYRLPDLHEVNEKVKL